MYFYEIEVYYPFYKNDKIIIGHDDCFDNHQLNVIVQEAFDECIEEYCNKSLLGEGEEACRIEVGTIFEKHLPSHFNNHFKVHAFECTYCESCMDVCEQNAIMVTPAEWEELQ